MKPVFRILFWLAAAIIAGVFLWQGITSGGNPDPTAPNTSPMAALLNIGVLVFREGLECILVLLAITASMVGKKQSHRKPVMIGAGIAFLASIVTWFIAVGILHSLSGSVSALNLQAATGLLAVIVLLVIMNWFFHKIYWGGWMTMHNRRKKTLLESATDPEISHRTLLWGLGLLGFTSLYREGFEIVLFLQSYYLRMGGQTVLGGAVLGLFFTGLVGILAFVAHRRLPYRKMLILTGLMLGVVLLVMVGEQAQEMQLAHWIPTTTIDSLASRIPPWMGLWLSVYPTRETLLAQLIAAIIVIGSYYLSRGMSDSPQEVTNSKDDDHADSRSAEKPGKSVGEKSECVVSVSAELNRRFASTLRAPNEFGK